MTVDRAEIAYFSMEIALNPGMPTYSGGLGILAGDTIRTAADMKLPMVAVSLLHRSGYFHQRIDAHGVQSEEPVRWAPDDFLEEVGARVTVQLGGRDIVVRAMCYEVEGRDGHVVPVYLLDTNVPENDDDARQLTQQLYGGDARYRLSQEAILGIGGARMLRAIGHGRVRWFHMNEGHSSLLTLELLEREAAGADRETITREDVEAVRQRCVFTTHTPVPAGHDQFSMELVTDVLGDHDAFAMRDVFCHDGLFNMTYVALNLSHYVNGVAKRHGLVSKHIFGGSVVDAITNGVHVGTWASPAFRRLFDSYVPGWPEDNFSLSNALKIPSGEIWKAHQEQKSEMLRFINRIHNVGMDVDVLTLGFARRMTAYKRPDLLFRDLDELQRIAREVGPLQIIYAGKAHPADSEGKTLIRRIIEMGRSINHEIRFAYLQNYDMDLAQLLTAGVDVWLNTPKPPMEASGTSGMKAALNGVPSLSILDGWWLEGCLEGVTGWSIGKDSDDETSDVDDAAALYRKLGDVVVPLYYENRDGFIDVMRHSIAINGSFFNAQRMLQQYVVKAYMT
jgi:starch phosphorylase